jgi:hypothetical protein
MYTNYKEYENNEKMEWWNYWLKSKKPTKDLGLFVHALRM